jgi:hypothetical protein
MKSALFSDPGIADDPHNGLLDLLAQSDDDIEVLLAYLGDFFVECPDTWKQFCACWAKWHEDENMDDNV